MNSLFNKFENGFNHPYRTISEKEALQTACQAVGVFANPNSPQYVREMAMYDAGRNVGAIQDPDVSYQIESILKKCSKLRSGETVALSWEEKSFIKAGVEGTLFRPFYE